MEETNRLQQLAGIITEIKVNNPLQQYKLYSSDGVNEMIILKGTENEIKQLLWDKIIKDDRPGDYQIRKID